MENDTEMRYNEMFELFDPHLVSAMLSWMYQNPALSEARRSSALQLMKQLGTVHNLSWVFEENDLEAPAEVLEEMENRQALQVKLEPPISSLVGCLIALKGNHLAEGGNVSEKLVPRSIAEYDQIWQSRKEMVSQQSEEKQVEGGADSVFGEFSAETLTDMLTYARLFYAGGAYGDSAIRSRFYLDCVCDLVIEAAKDEKVREEYLWGVLLSSCMLLRHASPQKNQDFKMDYNAIPQYILQLVEMNEVKHSNNKLYFLNQTYLLKISTWLIFKYFFLTKTPPKHLPWMELFDWYFSEKSQQCISKIAPYLLRYYAAIAILNRKREDHVRQAANAITANAHRYTDPLTRLLNALFVAYDFDQGQVELPLISTVCAQDFFLSTLVSKIEDSSRLLVFNNFCRIHRSINLKMIADKLHMGPEEAERWIVTLIRDAKLDAKIDSEKNVVEMTTQAPNFHKIILQSTKNLIFRSQSLLQSIQS